MSKNLGLLSRHNHFITAKTAFALLTIIAIASTFSSAHAAVVSVNFQGGDTNGLLSGDTTGVTSASHWYNATGSLGGPVALNDPTGGPSGLTLTSYSAGPFGVNGPDTDDSTAQLKLFSGSLGVNYGPATFTLTGLGEYSSYDLIVYYTGGPSFPESRTASISASGSPDTFFVAGDNDAYTAFDQSNDTLAAIPPDTQTFGVGNYVLFSGLTAASETVTMNYVNNNTGLVGFQVVGAEVPEPASLGLLALAGMGLLSRRRRANMK